MEFIIIFAICFIPVGIVWIPILLSEAQHKNQALAIYQKDSSSSYQTSRIVLQCTGAFSHKLGRVKKCSLLFAPEKLIFCKPLSENHTGFSTQAIDKNSILDILLYSDISTTTQSSSSGFGAAYQVLTKGRHKIQFRVMEPEQAVIENLLSSPKNTFYKSSVEKKSGIVSGDRAAIEAIIDAKHVSGLPLAEGIQCKILGSTDSYQFKTDHKTINLDMSKVSDVSVRTDVEIQKSYVSDIGKAILGGNSFGVLGAALGGMATEKTSKIVHHYLIFSYMQDSEQKYLSFLIENVRAANALVALFHPKTLTQIEL